VTGRLTLVRDAPSGRWTVGGYRDIVDADALSPGHSLGNTLWEWLGAGALGIPLLGIGLALAGFERLGTLDMKRSAFLIIGLSVLLPYLAGVVGQVRPENINSQHFLGRMVGAIPGFFAVEIRGWIGLGGAILAGFLALSALTLLTFAWHPLQRLERQPEAATPAPGKGEPARAESRRKPAKPPPPVSNRSSVVFS
jgi:hypothetical protein